MIMNCARGIFVILSRRLGRLVEPWKTVKEMEMRKIFGCLALLALLATPLAASAQEVASNPAGNPVDQFTGKIWLDSSEDNLKAYLFGIDTAIAVESAIQDQQAARKAKAGKKPVHTLSPFERGWAKAFKDVSREQIIAEVTKWYKDHPSDLDRPVMAVIWHELVVPRLDAEK